MPALFSVHMIAHMLYSMGIPVMLVLGGPVTLALRALKPAGRDGLPGIREWLVVFINNPVSRFLT
ncbi:cytochrome c oxidase assembly protein, partial [Escherichia coli]|nr:cytochrome c oxidase assembly protein [Escherichia coli]